MIPEKSMEFGFPAKDSPKKTKALLLRLMLNLPSRRKSQLDHKSLRRPMEKILKSLLWFLSNTDP
jgi:hypothetical protein